MSESSFDTRSGVGRVAAAARDLSVLDAGQLVVLLPEVGLEDLRRGKEPQDRLVSGGQRALCQRLRDVGEDAGPEGCRSGPGKERSTTAQGSPALRRR